MPQVYRRDAQERMRNSEKQLETLADVASSTKSSTFVEKRQDRGKHLKAFKG